MDEPKYHIPLDLLQTGLQALIPPEEEILYTSRCSVRKKSFLTVYRSGAFGQLAITNKAIILHAKKMGMRSSFADMGGHVDYIPFKDIVVFKNKKKKIYVKFIIPDDPKRKKKRGYIISVERCKEVNEDKKEFNKRKKLFGDFIEKLIL
ncbi:MAG: hypothetical protein HWN67_15500 [Candidatus Helarchaeota archaeon]|nr:hypothetical protein [Candidatus Helarchaeota archaeon]